MTNDIGKIFSKIICSYTISTDEYLNRDMENEGIGASSVKLKPSDLYAHFCSSNPANEPPGETLYV